MEEPIKSPQIKNAREIFLQAVEARNGSKSELEFKPTPLHRYASEQERVLDGVIFSFALGTDPEVLMLAALATWVATERLVLDRVNQHSNGQDEPTHFGLLRKNLYLST